jgi:hypothetical protein
VVTNPGDGALFFASLLDVQLYTLKGFGVIRNGSLSFGGKFVLGVDDKKGLHGGISLWN